MEALIIYMLADINMARMGPKGGPVYSHIEWTESSLHKIQVGHLNKKTDKIRRKKNTAISNKVGPI